MPAHAAAPGTAASARATTQYNRSPQPPGAQAIRPTRRTEEAGGNTELRTIRFRSATPAATSAASNAASGVGPLPLALATRMII
jgi:hypothetical protein